MKQSGTKTHIYHQGGLVTWRSDDEAFDDWEVDVVHHSFHHLVSGVWSASEGTGNNLNGLRASTWKPGPESGRDCLIHVPHSLHMAHNSEYGTYKTVKAMIWPWLSNMCRVRCRLSNTCRVRYRLSNMCRDCCWLSNMWRVRCQVSDMCRVRCRLSKMCWPRCRLSYMCRFRCWLSYMWRIRCWLSYMCRSRCWLSYMWRIRSTAVGIWRLRSRRGSSPLSSPYFGGSGFGFDSRIDVKDPTVRVSGFMFPLPSEEGTG